MTKNPKIVKEENLIIRLEDGTRITPQNYFVEPHTSSLKNYGLVYQKGSKVPFTGAVKKSIESFVLDTTINKVAYYKDGKRTDLYESYKNGHLRSRENIKNDYIYNGLQEYYYDTGQLKTSENFKDDLRDGQRTTYRLNGSITFSEKWKDGELHGPSKYYDENKEGGEYLRRLDHYKNGEQDGLAETYHSNGQLMSKFYSKNYNIEGLSVSYYSDGQLQRKANYKNGEQDGPEEEYFEDGQLKLKGYYKEGNLIESENYDEDGSLKDGCYKEYFEDGQLSSELNFKHGTQEGLMVVKCSEGKLLFEGFFKNGNLQDSMVAKNGEMLFVKANALTYMINTKHPFTGIAEYFRDNTIIAVKTFFQGLLYGELDLSQIEPVWGTYIETLWQKTQEEIEDIYVYHNDKESKFLSIRGEVEGSFKSYYANGQLESKENYFNRKPHGLFEYFDEEGTLLESKTWKNGLLVQ